MNRIKSHCVCLYRHSNETSQISYKLDVFDLEPNHIDIKIHTHSIHTCESGILCLDTFLISCVVLVIFSFSLFCGWLFNTSQRLHPNWFGGALAACSDVRLVFVWRWVWVIFDFHYVYNSEIGERAKKHTLTQCFRMKSLASPIRFDFFCLLCLTWSHFHHNTIQRTFCSIFVVFVFWYYEKVSMRNQKTLLTWINLIINILISFSLSLSLFFASVIGCEYFPFHSISIGVAIECKRCV